MLLFCFKYGTRHNKNGYIQRFLCNSRKRTLSIIIGLKYEAGVTALLKYRTLTIQIVKGHS